MQNSDNTYWQISKLRYFYQSKWKSERRLRYTWLRLALQLYLYVMVILDDITYSTIYPLLLKVKNFFFTGSLTDIILVIPSSLHNTTGSTITVAQSSLHCTIANMKFEHKLNLLSVLQNFPFMSNNS